MYACYFTYCYMFGKDIGVVSYYAKETYFILMAIFIGIGQITKEENFIAGNYKK